ncbi:unnamed protein product [Rotaria sp. Silwood1]|nr:unnamed protein product [Rotaria sp. Silwood1]CAF3617450.1 unnamed protein product [Rotaria sp. Silwood1]CAF3629414.1 unnamed protein product [Rotaria sp. Silwood1]CAF3716381.1 unnamed protein product [Rotaria sp. Silwood1]CAF3728678.1 unnamed protein product [Rotaria sp. Silwood1]
MEDEMLDASCRCFVLSGDQDEIVGFLTLKDEGNNSIYIAQCAIRADIKRKGYGTQLLLHLRTIYPPGTHYWGLCRRANRPAVQFYIRQGAKYIKDDDVANKYGYDPNLYTGFEFDDPTPIASNSENNIPPSEPMDRSVNASLKPSDPSQ